MGGRPRGPRGGRRRLGDRMPGSCRRLPPPPRAASWGAGHEPSTHLPSTSQPVPPRSAYCPHHRAGSPAPPHTPPDPNSRWRLRSPPAGTPPHCSAAAAPPPPPARRGPSPPSLTSQGVSSPEPRLLDSYSTVVRSSGSRKAGLLGLCKLGA